MSTTTPPNAALHPAARGLAAEEERILACVHCGFCLSACPTYTRLGDEADSPRGRIYLMRAVAEGRIEPDDASFAHHIDLCLGCRACEPVCPSGVEYGRLVEHARNAIAQATRTNPAARLLLRVFGNRFLTALVGIGGRLMRVTRIPGLIGRAGGPRGGRIAFAMAMLAATSPHRLRSVPGAAAAPADPTNGERTRVALLRGCVQQALFSRINDATARVLVENRCTVVHVPGQGCCGALHGHGGDLDGARVLARRNIAAFEASGAEFIIVNAAGCGAMMKEYGALLEADPAFAERASAFERRVRDVTEFLAERGPRPGAPLQLRVTYDAPCHLHHAQGVTRAPLDVLRAIPGIEHVPLRRADECCGGAGIYGLLHAELGGHILRDKVDAIRETGADMVVTPNPGCAMQIGAGLLRARMDLPVLHPIELLDESYRRQRENR